MTNLMIPEELAPLANFNWSQFSDTYTQDADIQQDPHVSIQIESGIPGNGSKVVVDVKDVPIGSSGFLPNTNRVQLHGWREDRNGDISSGGYCSFDGGDYKILRKFEDAPFDWLLEDADYTIEDMVKDFTKEVKDYLDYGNYRYHAVYDVLTQTYDDLYKEHEDALSMMHTKKYHREDVDGIRIRFNAYGEEQNIYGEFVHELHKTPFVRVHYNGTACVIDCPTGRNPMDVESDIVSEMKDFLAGELEPHIEELYGNIMKQLREQSVDAEEMLDGLSQDGLQL